MNKILYDSFKIEHKRKNKYLEALSNGENVSRDKHPYNEKLDAFKKLEKIHLDDLKQVKLKGDAIEKLKIRKEIAKRHLEFYDKFYDLTYDASLMVNISICEINSIDRIISTYEDQKKQIELYEVKLKNLDSNLENQKKQEYEIYKKELLEKSKVQKQEIKNKKENGLISEMAYKNAIKVIEKRTSDEIKVKELEIPSKEYKATLDSLKYSIKNDLKTNIKILESDISDIRRRTPIEVESVNKALPYLTFILPGLGQLLNKQYFKAICMFILSLFMYCAAIPYILGFGNYQGKGLYGLYTLAKNGTKLDKSMIFMIEGIISLFLVCLVIAILYLSFKDVKQVLEDKLIGIRPRTYFETVESLKEDGIPYVVTSVAFILILFIVIVPIMTTILLSFTGMDPKHQAKFTWIGLENYKLLLQGKGIAGGPFWLIIAWTIIWTLGASSMAIFVGFMLAIIANNERIKGKAIFRTIYLLPWAVPAFITIMFFSIMASPTGSITWILSKITGMDIVIKNSPTYTRIFLILMQTWLGSSYVFLLSTGVLQAISSDLYEAADIDGATSWQKLSKITVPLVLFQTAPLLIGQYTFNFNNFSIIYLFNGGGPFLPTKYGNIAGSTDLLISYIYKLTIERRYQAAGAAITIFISIGLMIVAYIGFKNSKAFKEDAL